MVFGPIQIPTIYLCVIRRVMTFPPTPATSGPHAPTQLLTNFVLCVLLQCIWYLEIPGGTGRPCCVEHLMLAVPMGTYTLPCPQPSSPLHLNEVPVCWNFQLVNFETVFTSLFCFLLIYMFILHSCDWELFCFFHVSLCYGHSSPC